MKDLSRRALPATISAALVIGVLRFAFVPWFEYGVAAFISFLTAVAVWEYEQLAIAKGSRMIYPFLALFAIGEVFSFFLAAQFPFLISLPLIVFFVGFLTLFALYFREKDGALVNLAVSSFGLFYIAIPMGMILQILYSDAGQDGRWWVGYLLVVTKITDIGAYFAGNLWGKRKLAPHISPGKTIEGAIFGLLCAIFASFAFHWMSASFGMGRFSLDDSEWLTFGILFGLVGQFGDLSESLLKRDANKKDSNALPGLGGILDAIDSLLFNAPILYIYLQFLKN